MRRDEEFMMELERLEREAEVQEELDALDRTRSQTYRRRRADLDLEQLIDDATD